MRATLQSIACLMTGVYLSSLPIQTPGTIVFSITLMIGWIGLGILGFMQRD